MNNCLNFIESCGIKIDYSIKENKTGIGKLGEKDLQASFRYFCILKKMLVAKENVGQVKKNSKEEALF